MVDFDIIAVEVEEGVAIDNCDGVDGDVVRAAHKLLPTLPTVLVARILLVKFLAWVAGVGHIQSHIKPVPDLLYLSRWFGDMRGCIVTSTLLLLGSSFPLICVALTDCNSPTSSNRVWIAES